MTIKRGYGAITDGAHENNNTSKREAHENSRTKAMSIIENYITDGTMRRRVFKINGITHAEVCDATDCANYSDPNAYIVMLSDGNGNGWYEPQEFATIGQALQWCAKYAPELKVIG